jgi:histone-lysine N-methyltransferase SETDB1
MSSCDAQKTSRCTACGEGKKTTTSHPLLDVPICEDCKFYYNNGEFYLDSEGRNEIYCRWCGEGTGELCLCDSCPKSFCSGCIQRNFGLAEIVRIRGLNERWNCYICSPQALDDLCEKNGWNSHSGGSIGKKRKSSNPHIVCDDITRGRERFAIPAFNDVDKEPAPLDFCYVNKHVAGNTGERVNMSNNPSFLSCCSCTDNCKDASKCECAILMGGFAYNSKGIYSIPKPEGVYECNQRCPCHLNRCKNRVVGKGPHLKLEVFRCSDPNKGWGVRCTTDIQAGTYVADYLGEIMLENHADGRGLSESDEYLFQLDAWGRSHACQRLSELGMKKGLLSIPQEYEMDVSVMSKNEISDLLGAEFTELLHTKGALDRATSLGMKESKGEASICRPCAPKTRADRVSSSSSNTSNDTVVAISDNTVEWKNRKDARNIAFKKATEIIKDRAILEVEDKNDTFTVDAKRFGNVGRFLNHSCSPNLDIVTVMVESHDVRIPRVAFFTSDFIPANLELCYDYGYLHGNVDGKSRKCLCGADSCRKVLY